MQMITDHTFTPDDFGVTCIAGIGGGELCWRAKHEHQSEQPDLDGARDEAAKLLRRLIHGEAIALDNSFIISVNLGLQLDDIARQYVTAQARYANMLQEWEKANEPDF